MNPLYEKIYRWHLYFFIGLSGLWALAEFIYFFVVFSTDRKKYGLLNRYILNYFDADYPGFILMSLTVAYGATLVWPLFYIALISTGIALFSRKLVRKNKAKRIKRNEEIKNIHKSVDDDFRQAVRDAIK